MDCSRSKKYCLLPSEENFNKLSPSVRRSLYISSIECPTNHILCTRTKKYYKYLAFTGGIHGRKELLKNYRKRLTPEMKGIIKHDYIQKIIRNGVSPKSIYFYDDTKEICSKVKTLGVNSICVNPLDIKHLLDLFDKNVSYVLLDFNGTITSRQFGRRHLAESNLIPFFESKQRLDLLFFLLKTLEESGVKIGIITCHSRDDVVSALKRIGWLN